MGENGMEVSFKSFSKNLEIVELLKQEPFIGKSRKFWEIAFFSTNWGIFSWNFRRMESTRYFKTCPECALAFPGPPFAFRA